MAGVKVLDLGAMIAGPGAATILADQGADVIKVEPPGIGDVMRYLGATRNGVSGLYQNCNRGKRSLALDLKSPAGVQVLYDLVAGVDVVLENFRPGVASRLGVDYQTLRRHNPDLIYLSVCGFGDRGPYADKAAYDNVIQAFGGVAHSQADPQTGEPIQYYQLFSDKLTALTGAQAISSALFARAQGRGGQHIRLSMVDSVASFLWADVAGTAAFCDDGASEGLSVAKGVKLVAFRDGYGTAAPVTDQQFLAWAGVFGVDASDPRLATVAGRNAHRELTQVIGARVMARAREMAVDEAMAALEAAGVPCARVMALADLPAHPQMQANESFVMLEHPRAGRMVEPRNPPRFGSTPASAPRPCADLGQHTDEILLALGRTNADITALRGAGVVA